MWRVALVGVGYGLWRRRSGRLARMPEDYDAYWHRRTRRPGELRYVALGDSLAQGLSARRPERGFVGLLADGLAGSTGREIGVLNWSVTGATVADVLADQVPRLASLAESAGPPVGLVTVCVGSNDVGRTEPDRFRARFRELCAALPAGALVTDIPDFRRGPHRAAAAEYSRGCRDVLAEFPALRAVRLERATRTIRVRELGPDLAHPGDAGHRRYAAAFARAGAHAPG
jgi:lysophospholipase L1-like esterase